MPWFWSSSSAPQETASDKKDVYADLSPELQAFARGDGEKYKREFRAPNETKETAARPTFTAVKEPTNMNEALEASVTASKDRRSKINSGAMFNCALKEYDLNQCFLGGSWWDKSKLCEEQKAAFWQCLQSNKKALEILGYAEHGNTAAHDEKLLDIADDLVDNQVKNSLDTLY